MTLLSLLIFLVVIGFLLWLVNTYVPLQPSFKTLINVVVILCTIIWLLKSSGLLSGNL